jgi:hypothetical protein
VDRSIVACGPRYGVTGTVTGVADLVRLAYSAVMAPSNSDRSSDGQTFSEIDGS